MAMSDEDVNFIMKDLQQHLQKANVRVASLSTIAQKGDEKLVERFMTESVFIRPSGGNKQLAEDKVEVLQSQLYIASFWGFRDIIKGIITLAEEKNIGLNVNAQNKDTRWTPLHAATFQEHGPAIMDLIEYGADPQLPDAEGRSPKDFASASDKVWGHFAALGLRRTPKHTLNEMGIIKQISSTDGISPVPSPREPGKGIRMAEYSSPQSHDLEVDPSRAFGGDVLAGDGDIAASGGSQKKQPRFMAYK